MVLLVGDHAHDGYGCSGKEVCRMWDNLINACRGNHPSEHQTFLGIYIDGAYFYNVYLSVSMLNIQVLPT